MTHGFDDQGRKFDGDGNLRDWWTPTDGAEFDKRASCVANEYSGFTAVDDVKLNGRLTLGENTADNGGLRIALMALQDTLQGQGREAGRLHAGAAILPRIRPDLVREHRAPGSTRPRHDGPPLARPLSRQRHATELAGVPKGIFLQGGTADGQSERLPRLVGPLPTCAADPSPAAGSSPPLPSSPHSSPAPGSDPACS